MNRSSLAAFCLSSLLVAGCASPPSPIDLTPQFVTGQSRIEGVQAFAKITTPIKDLEAHLGIAWKARVLSVGPQGAEIQASLSRLVLSLPGGIGFDTDSIIPLGSLGLAPALAPLLSNLVGLTFVYNVGPGGAVTVREWDNAVLMAARKAGIPVPADGSIPGQSSLAGAISRAYLAVPYRVVRLKESTTRAVDYTLAPDQGAQVVGEDTLTYKGFADFEFDFGSDEQEVEGLDLSLRGSGTVGAGASAHGFLAAQSTSRGGKLVMSVDGKSLLYYRESTRTQLQPNVQIPYLEVLEGIRIADYDTGWVFFAESAWD